MGLKFPGGWRFTPPADGSFINTSIPDSAIWEFIDAIDKIAGQGSRWRVLEHFKNHYGNPHQSSTESWAESDLQTAMRQSAENAPLFIESFFNGCEALTNSSEEWYAPDAGFINKLLAKHNIGYEIRSSELVACEHEGRTIPVEVTAPSIEERAKSLIDSSLDRSDELLAEGRPREAVQEILWLLETVSTGFRGIETESGKIEGKYFNNIVREIKASHRGTTLEQILNWVTQMHGFLSSPKGGGVRHGIDLREGVHLSANEARFFCNLTRSYISFLLSGSMRFPVVATRCRGMALETELWKVDGVSLLMDC